MTVELINETVKLICTQKAFCSVMLTGGRSAARIYRECSPLLAESGCKIDFYFGDERCVPSDHKESNYRLAVNSLFASGSPIGNCKLYKITGDAEDSEQASQA